MISISHAIASGTVDLSIFRLEANLWDASADLLEHYSMNWHDWANPPTARQSMRVERFIMTLVVIDVCDTQVQVCM